MEIGDYLLRENFKDRDVIIEEGFTSNYAYVVISGQVKISKKIGDKKIIIGTLKGGDVFGEMGLIEKSPRTATVTAVGDVEVGMINKETFTKLVDDIPEEFRCIVQALVDRLRITTEKLATIGLQLEKAKRTLTSLSLHTKELNER